MKEKFIWQQPSIIAKSLALVAFLGAEAPGKAGALPSQSDIAVATANQLVRKHTAEARLQELEARTERRLAKGQPVDYLRGQLSFIEKTKGGKSRTISIENPLIVHRGSISKNFRHTSYPDFSRDTFGSVTSNSSGQPEVTLHYPELSEGLGGINDPSAPAGSMIGRVQFAKGQEGIDLQNPMQPDTRIILGYEGKPARIGFVKPHN